MERWLRRRIIKSNSNSSVVITDCGQSLGIFGDCTTVKLFRICRRRRLPFNLSTGFCRDANCEDVAVVVQGLVGLGNDSSSKQQ